MIRASIIKTANHHSQIKKLIAPRHQDIKISPPSTPTLTAQSASSKPQITQTKPVKDNKTAALNYISYT